MSISRQCMICEGDFDDHVALAFLCLQNHSICRDCLKPAIDAAVQDESNWPITCRCTDAIPVSIVAVERMLADGDNETNKLLEQLRGKVEEYSVPRDVRIFCANKVCSAIQGHPRVINPLVSGEAAAVICPDCDAITCRLCHDLVDMTAGGTHICKPNEHDNAVAAYIASLPEGERWLVQKCYSCGSWVNKSEACNHITCRCTAQFCLVCGKQWSKSGNSCSHGCPLYEQPVYDDEGFNQLGYHRETGLDREGNPHNPESILDDGYGGNDDDDYDDQEPYYDERGFDRFGFDREGVDEDGYDIHGFRDGYDRSGFDFWGYDRQGFDHTGRDRDGRDVEGYDEAGYDRDGFDRGDLSHMNLSRDYYDENFLDPFGFDVRGYNSSGFDFEGWDIEGYDYDGYDSSIWALDRRGLGRDGFDRYGFNCHGVHRSGYDRRGYYAHHRDCEGRPAPGFYVAPDGNVRRIINEGPSAEVMDCHHRTGRYGGSATCYLCNWTSDHFYHHCNRCGANLCRDCDNAGYNIQQSILRRRFWCPGDESYGLREMFDSMGRLVI